MKLTNRLQDLWETGTRQAMNLAGRSREPGAEKGWAAWLSRQLADRPTTTLALGLLAGVTIGWLIKRR